MEGSICYTLIVSNDPLFVKRIRQHLSENNISKDWRTIVFSNERELADYKIINLFSFILKTASDDIVLIIDYESNFEYFLDITKVLNRYAISKSIIKIGLFGETSNKSLLENVMTYGCQIVDYKKTELGDFIHNIQLLKRAEFDSLPTYATSDGHGQTGWGEFLTEVEYINNRDIAFNGKFSKISPTEEWINKFMPNLSDSSFTVTNSKELDRKCRWLEDVNKLTFHYREAEFIPCDSINIKTINEQSDKTSFVAQKRVSPDQEAINDKNFVKHVSSLKSKVVNVMIFDEEIRMLDKKHQMKNCMCQTFSFPYFNDNIKLDEIVAPHIIAIELDRFSFVDDKYKKVKLNDTEKIELINEKILANYDDHVVVIFFGCGDIDVPKLKKRQLNVPFDINEGFLEKIVAIYFDKYEYHPCKDNMILEKKSLVDHNKSISLHIEIPFVYEKINEHRLIISTPMELKDNQIIKINSPCTFYVLILNKLSDKGAYCGIIMGVNELDLMNIRQEVYRFMRIPKQTEDSLERLQFLNMNNNEFMKRQKEALKNKNTIDLSKFEKKEMA